MSNDNTPFSIGQKVVALKSGSHGVNKGDVCTVVYQVQCTKCKSWLVGVAEFVGFAEGSACRCGKPVWHIGYKNYCGDSKYFAPYNPYSNSASKELAEKAMNVGDGADQPIKIKELETSN